MTLADWCRLAYTEPLPADGGAVSVRCDPALYPTLYGQLWRLSDYRVDTSWGIVVWLMPGSEPCGDCGSDCEQGNCRNWKSVSESNPY